jgi:hypothetical protein
MKLFGNILKWANAEFSVIKWLSQYPLLAEQGLAGYGNLSVNTSVNGEYFGGFAGVFLLRTSNSATKSLLLNRVL